MSATATTPVAAIVAVGIRVGGDIAGDGHPGEAAVGTDFHVGIVPIGLDVVPQPAGKGLCVIGDAVECRRLECARVVVYGAGVVTAPRASMDQLCDVMSISDPSSTTVVTSDLASS